MTEEPFSVCQFFADDSYEYVRRHVPVEEAVKAAMHYCTSVGARMGTTNRVIITDAGDSICFEWTHDAGIIFGTAPNQIGTLKKGVA